MADVQSVLDDTLSLDGSIAIALVDHGNGLTLGQANRVPFDLDLAAAVNTDVVKAKVRAVESLGLGDHIEDILITLGKQYHLLRVVQRDGLRGTFLYLVLDRERGNLALARRALENAEANIEL